jgi:hypothetical protein
MERAIALDVTKQDVARRLRRVCATFSEADFDALVQQIAEIDVRYRLRDDWFAYRDPRMRLTAPYN